jgi:dipeptidyl aminopeptidase/acylaminoacyl peptidase
VSADGRFLLFVARRGDSFEESHLMVRPLATRESHVIGKGGSYARFAPGNRIVFNRGAALFAATFDDAAMTLRGIPQAILDAVQADPVYGGAWYAVARDGTVAYVPGDARPRGRRLLWVTPSGGETPAFAQERAFLYPAVSPDGRSVIVTIDTMQQDLWRFDAGGSILTRLTSSPGEDFGAVWSPDGRRIAYTSIRHGRPPAIFGKPADANDAETPLYSESHAVFPNAWSLADGVLLATVERVQEGMKSVQLLTLGTNGGASLPFLPSRHDRYAAALSPDGQQIAFVSLESGAAEVFVATMPDGRGVRQVSVGGGTSPVWSRDGRRLFYRHDDAVMAVDIVAITSNATTAPRELLRGRFEEPGRPDWPRNYDVAPDGRFLMIRETYKPTPQSIVFVLNWRGGSLGTGR